MPNEPNEKAPVQPETRFERVGTENAHVDMVHPEADGFKEKVTPIKPDNGVFFFKCACGGIHLRHAGYAKVMVPFIKAGGKKEVAMQEERVMVCVACKNCYIWNGEQMYDVTESIDLKAWEKSEVELNKATGPGGEC